MVNLDNVKMTIREAAFLGGSVLDNPVMHGPVSR